MKTTDFPYYTYSEYLKNTFGEKVYKLPIKLEGSCPNRNGSLSLHGCTFCGDEGGSFENLSEQHSIKEQILINKSYIGKKYHASKFIAYFQNFTNTYCSAQKLMESINNCKLPGIVGINISTRPDCISEEQMSALSEFSLSSGIDITIELGLQSVNPHTLKKINRGHGVAEYIQTVLLLKRYGIKNCTHLILNLPWDDDIDAVEAAKLLSVLGADEVKLHSLYILKNTILGEQYVKNEFSMISVDEYEERIILFLRNLDKPIAVQRLMARAPEESCLFCNWNQSWWKIRDRIVLKMIERGVVQGDQAFVRYPIEIY